MFNFSFLPPKKQHAGFTLIEIIAVLLIIGIIGAVVITRVVSTNEIELNAQVEKIKSQLRYAQMRSMNDSSIWGISFTGSQYWLFKDASTASKVNLPGEDSNTVDLPEGTNSSQTVAFDSWGRPYDFDSGSENDMTFTIGGKSAAILIYKNTGYVP